MAHTRSRPPWLGVELRHLAALAAVAEEGSFRAAAARLGYVQSAVSRQIATLERMLGARLLDRPRGSAPVALTPAGRLVVGRFDAILAQLGAAQADVDALRDGRAGTIRLAAAANVEARVVAPALRRLGPRSRVRLEVSRCVDDAAAAAVAEHRADAALLSGPLPAGPFAAQRLLEDPLVLLVRASDARAGRAEAPPLAGLPLITRAEARDTDTAFDDVPAPRVVHATDDDAAAHALVAAGAGVAVLPRLSVDPADGRVAALPLAGVRPRVLSLVWHAEREPAPALEALRAALAAVCRELSAVRC